MPNSNSLSSIEFIVKCQIRQLSIIELEMAGNSVDEKWSIDKLDGSNWTTWKFQMRHLLLAKGLWGHVDGTAVLAANAQAQTEFNRKSQRAFSTIVLAIGTSQLYLVRIRPTWLHHVSSQKMPGMF